MKLNPNRAVKAMFVFAAAASLLQSAFAGPPVFVYTSRDMMLCFRKTGANGNLEINIGQASLFYNATPGATIHISQFSGTLYSNVFDDLNNVSWSVASFVPVTGDSGDASVPLKTLWATAPRVDPNVQSFPGWVRNSPTAQATVASRMNAIPVNASFYSGTVPSDTTSNSAANVVVPVGSGHEYGALVGTAGNYLNSFQGNVEKTNSPTFTTDNQPARADLYELRPDSTGTQPPGKFLGYFELTPAGTLSFVAASPAPPAPTLTIHATNGVQTVTFPTVNGANYTLYSTNSAGLSAPVSTWPVSTNVIGDGSTVTFLDNSTDANRFYRIVTHF
jgi:hypothetical protein